MHPQLCEDAIKKHKHCEKRPDSDRPASLAQKTPTPRMARRDSQRLPPLAPVLPIPSKLPEMTSRQHLELSGGCWSSDSSFPGSFWLTVFGFQTSCRHVNTIQNVPHSLKHYRNALQAFTRHKKRSEIAASVLAVRRLTLLLLPTLATAQTVFGGYEVGADYTAYADIVEVLAEISTALPTFADAKTIYESGSQSGGLLR